MCYLTVARRYTNGTPLPCYARPLNRNLSPVTVHGLNGLSLAQSNPTPRHPHPFHEVSLRLPFLPFFRSIVCDILLIAAPGFLFYLCIIYTCLHFSTSRFSWLSLKEAASLLQSASRGLLCDRAIRYPNDH